MTIAGIICEYNPMHIGHVYHIEETRRRGADAVVCCMSGNYVQRGEPAFIDKWARARTAIGNGADLVVELPSPWVLESAGTFARAGVFILDALNCSLLSFGVEDSNADLLEKIAEFCSDESVFPVVSEKMSGGMTYPSALCSVIGEKLGEEAKDYISKPNNILAVEYLKAIRALSSDLKILPIVRKGEGHSSNRVDSDYISSTAIRNSKRIAEVFRFLAGGIEKEIAESASGGTFPTDIKTGEKAILCSLSSMSREEIVSYCPKEETGRRIFNSLTAVKDIDELVAAVKNKSITEASVRRSILRVFLNLPTSVSSLDPPYIHVLAANETGIEILKKNSGKKGIPVLTKHSEAATLDSFAKTVYNLECSATAKYGAFTPSFAFNGAEQLHSIIKF